MKMKGVLLLSALSLGVSSVQGLSVRRSSKMPREHKFVAAADDGHRRKLSSLPSRRDVLREQADLGVGLSQPHRAHKRLDNLTNELTNAIR